MNTVIQKALRKPTAADIVCLIKSNSDLSNLELNELEVEYVKKEHRSKNELIEVNKFKNKAYVVYGETKGTRCKRLEAYRKAGNNTLILLNKAKISRIVVNAVASSKEETVAFVEGIVLGNYQWLKYIQKI